MKRFLILSVGMAVTVMGLAIGNSLLARADNLMTEAHIQRIRSN
ncbi:MAG TPA: hypothetical protein VL481_02910 [Verrucomicrobiae bacterium]|nr:hypothetical protein [Verrucomicrobiae bacterium]